MTAGDYDARTSEFKRHVGSGTVPPRAQYALAIQADGPEVPAREFELVGVHVVGFGPRVVALDPELDPRKGLRVEGLRGVSLSNFLNHVIGMARSGLPSEPGSHRWIPFRTLDALAHGLDTRLDLERQAILLAHDFRPANPERKAAHVRTAVAEFVLLQLATGWTFSGRVFDFDAELSKAGETHFFNVQAPKAYGDAARFAWGRDLPFVAVNRQFLVGYVRAQTPEELEDALRSTPELQPPGYTAEDGA